MGGAQRGKFERQILAPITLLLPSALARGFECGRTYVRVRHALGMSECNA